MRDAELKPNWLRPLIAILGLQVTATYVTRVISTIAPALSEAYGMPEAAIGYVASAGMVGSIVFLLCVTPLIKQQGSIRVLQHGLVFGIVGLIVLLIPHWGFAVLASLIIGLGYGASVPAGNEVLQRIAPARNRIFIFSIKQAGVPLGGMIAGLVLPPLIENFGWHSALWVSAIFILATLAAVQPFRASIDKGRDIEHPVGWRDILSRRNLVSPLITLREHNLLRVGIIGGCFAVGQSVYFAFLVTFAVASLNMSLTAAGLLFAIMQAAGIVGRMVLGFIADRIGANLTLTVVAVASSATSVTIAFANESWPFWLSAIVAGIAGVTVSSWNGVQLAMIGRFAPGTQISEAFAGASIVGLIGYIIGPSLFALLVATQGYMAGFLLTAAITLVALWPLFHLRNARPAADIPG